MVLLLSVGAAQAEVFHLANGGRLEGKWINQDEKNPAHYVIQLPTGGQITLDAAQVSKVEAATEQSEYDKVRPQYADTPQAQWELAEWCKEHDLPIQRKKHLQRILELDTDHAEARRALGFNKIDGKWTTQAEEMARQGRRLYKGRWRIPQEIELEENRRKQDTSEKDWFGKIKRWRGWIGTDKEQLAREGLNAIADPAATKALAMGVKNDSSQEVRIVYIEALARIDTPDAAKYLGMLAVDDANEEIRLTCLEHLQKMQNKKDMVVYFIGRLHDRDNATINRAAVALRYMKEPAAISPLIDALVTSHKQKIGSGNPGQMTTSFPTGGTKGGGGMSAGGGPRIIQFSLQNQAVLDALTALTGQNFSFHEAQWRTWYSQQRKADSVDTRRN